MNNLRWKSLPLAALLVLSVIGSADAAPNLCNGPHNGILDGKEQCETGPCCSDKCEFLGAFAVCRPAGADPICDPAETCGAQAPAVDLECPADAKAPNGTSCEDGFFCTVGEVCTGGVCGGGQPNTCDDDNDCTSDSCNDTSNTCQHSAAPNGTSCDDGDACTSGDTCSGGLCSGTSKTCDDGNACTDDDCDPDTGECTFTNNSAPCEDGLFCTVGDVCAGGACTGGPQNACDDGEGCTTDLCNEATQACSHVTAPDGTGCEDGLFCTDGDTCAGGVCVSGPPTSCNDDNDCTKDQCDENAKACSHSATNNQGPCFDGSLCTLDDTCRNGVCEGGPPKTCYDGNPCTDDACNPNTGQCDFTPNDAPCSDGLFCTTGDACVAGVCTPSGSTCDDANPCTTDTCDEGLQECGHTNNANPCDDGLFCTVGDACANGACVGGPANSCNDDNACTSDSCSEASHACEHANLSGACDDGNACTSGDTCSAGVCTGTPKDCNDGNPCTSDSCNAGTGDCENVNNTAACDDGLFCTFPDVCSGGVCTAGPARTCSDGNQCTSDSCNEEADTCEHANISGECDDGLYCTINDTCSGGICSGTGRDCNDDNVCTSDACNELTDSCDHLDNTVTCDDGIFCNGVDTCAGGTCSVHPGDPCPGPDNDGNCKESCDEAAKACSADDPDKSACSDGNSCTLLDHCEAGVCISGEAEPGCKATTTTTVVEETTTTLAAVTTTTEPAEGTTTTLAAATTTTGETETTTTLAVVPTTIEHETTTTVGEVTTTTLSTLPCGDFDDNGVINATDALGVLRTAVGLDTCEPSVCDFNGDGRIGAIDALGVLREAVGLPTVPNCPAEASAAVIDRLDV